MFTSTESSSSELVFGFRIDLIPKFVECNLPLGLDNFFRSNGLFPLEELIVLLAGDGVDGLFFCGADTPCPSKFIISMSLTSRGEVSFKLFFFRYSPEWTKISLGKFLHVSVCFYLLCNGILYLLVSLMLQVRILAEQAVLALNIST